MKDGRHPRRGAPAAWRLTISLLGLTMLVACDPGFLLQGTVVDAAGRPVERAKVRVNCRGDFQAETLTDASGRFVGHDIGWYPDYCVIEVFRPDATEPVTWPMMPSCTRRRGARACLEVTAHLRLP